MKTVKEYYHPDKPGKKISRQRYHQILRYKAGICQKCNNPRKENITYCASCAKRAYGRQKVHPNTWDKVDWSQPIKAIAIDLGVSEMLVHKRMKERKIESYTKARWRNVDLSKGVKKVAYELQVSEQTVRTKIRGAKKAGTYPFVHIVQRLTGANNDNFPTQESINP